MCQRFSPLGCAVSPLMVLFHVVQLVLLLPLFWRSIFLLLWFAVSALPVFFSWDGLELVCNLWFVIFFLFG